MSKLRQSVRFWVSISIYGCVFLGQPLWAAQKSALIIGNSRYLLGDRLTNPQNDAEDIANKLKSLGFDVILLKDANLAQMLDSIDQFKSKLRQGDVALFYFAGHGLQVDGQNYLVPIDAKMNSRSRVAYEAVKLSDVSNALAQGNITNNIIIIDACRNDPFPKELRDGSRGLARLDSSVRSPKKKLFYLFASAPGTVAQDGKGRNGVFTQELLKYLGQAGLTMPDLYEAVSNGVLVASNNKQEVYHEGDMLARFSLVPSPVNNNVVAPVPSPVMAATPLVIPQANPLNGDELLMQQGQWRNPKDSLIWMRCSVGQTWTGNICEGEGKEMTWDEAVKVGNGLSYGGVTGWRLPLLGELRRLMIGDSQREAGYASMSILRPKASTWGWYWSALSTAPLDNCCAWFVDFSGNVSNDYVHYSHYVRLVRSDQ